MPPRHRIVAITLLSSSLAAASPASQPQPRPVAKSVHAELVRFIDRVAVRVAVRAHALTDDEGYPLVGNMHGKRPAPVEDAEPRKVEPRRVKLAAK